MISLQEKAKICDILAGCSDMIEGKFILADYKIGNILKNITDSKEVYELLSNCMQNFSFEREFGKAELRSSQAQGGFSIPEEPEKILPFVFCVLADISNRNIDFDAFLKKYYKNEQGRNAEYADFARDVILPFRDILADYFDITLEEIPNCKTASEEAESEDESLENNEEVENEEYYDDEDGCREVGDVDDEPEYDLEEEEVFEEEESDDNEILTADEVFFANVMVTADEILQTLKEERATGDMLDQVEYITKVLIQDCENQDMDNAMVIISMLEDYTRRLRKVKKLAGNLKQITLDYYDEM